MNNLSYGAYTRVNRKRARTLFDAGRTVRMVPSKMVPMTSSEVGYGMAIAINKAELTERYFDFKDFDDLASNFASYNCTYETGYYPAFYVK